MRKSDRMLNTYNIKKERGILAGFAQFRPSVYDPYEIETAEDPLLYAIIGTWFEGDVITATVKNCFANGCSKVFILDNDSPDDTCALAKAAGANIAEVYKTDFYDDGLRVRKMNQFMRKITNRERQPDLWWLFIDADEFPCGPHGEKLIDYLKTLDDKHNCVGGMAIDLYPTTTTGYTRDRHPADCMPTGIPRKGEFCSLAHWKHQLLRTRNGEVNLCQTRGLHTLAAKRVPNDLIKRRQPYLVLEPNTTIPIFHAPMRAKEDTERRLSVLCSKEQDGYNRGSLDDAFTNNNGSIKRWRTLEHVYNGEWDKVELPHTQRFGMDVVGIALYEWRKLLPDVLTFPRWYELETEQPAKLSLPLLTPPTISSSCATVGDRSNLLYQPHA